MTELNRFLLTLAFGLFLSAPCSAQQPREHSKVIKNVAFGKHPLQTLDVYTTRQQNAPILLFAHGGAWRTGDKNNRSHRKKGTFFSSAGFIFISTNYRLSPEITHPGHIEDLARAFAYVWKNCHRWQGDKSRIFLMGHSAGAHLVALLSSNKTILKKWGLTRRHIAGTILLDGAGYNIPLIRKYNPWSFARIYQQAFGNDENVLVDASPVYHSQGTGIAPMLILHVDRAMAQYQSKQLAQALRQNGNWVQVKMAANKSHRTLNTELGNRGDEPTRWVLQFLLNEKSKTSWRRR